MGEENLSRKQHANTLLDLQTFLIHYNRLCVKYSSWFFQFFWRSRRFCAGSERIFHRCKIIPPPQKWHAFCDHPNPCTLKFIFGKKWQFFTILGQCQLNSSFASNCSEFQNSLKANFYFSDFGVFAWFNKYYIIWSDPPPRPRLIFRPRPASSRLNFRWSRPNPSRRIFRWSWRAPADFQMAPTRPVSTPPP